MAHVLNQTERKKTTGESNTLILFHSDSVEHGNGVHAAQYHGSNGGELEKDAASLKALGPDAVAHFECDESSDK